MRQWSDVLDYHPLLFATIGAEACGTIQGNSVDISAFHDVMAVITYSCIGGTTDTFGFLRIKLQESDTFGTGSSYTDITDGAINGSFQIDTVYATALTYPFLASTTIYEKISDGTRKRYLRPHALFTGTAGCIFGVTIGVLLGRPRDTLYMTKGTVFASNVDEAYQPRSEA